MKSTLNCSLLMLGGLLLGSVTFAGPESAGGRIPVRDLTPLCEKHHLDRNATKVFVWDPPGPVARHSVVYCFDVDGGREFQRVPLHLNVGEVAEVSAHGRWQFSNGGPFQKFGPGGDGSRSEVTPRGLRAAPGSLIMDIHLNRFFDRNVFVDEDLPVTVHGPCESIAFIARDQLFSNGVESKGVLHVKIEVLEAPLVVVEDSGYTKETSYSK